MLHIHRYFPFFSAVLPGRLAQAMMVFWCLSRSDTRSAALRRVRASPTSHRRGQSRHGARPAHPEVWRQTVPCSFVQPACPRHLLSPECPAGDKGTNRKTQFLPPVLSQSKFEFCHHLNPFTQMLTLKHSFFSRN